MKLFGRGKEQAPSMDRPAQSTRPDCPHAALAPHWDSSDDMGKLDKVSSYVCNVCRATFDRIDGERMVAEVAERLRLGEIERRRN